MVSALPHALPHPEGPARQVHVIRRYTAGKVPSLFFGVQSPGARPPRLDDPPPGTTVVAFDDGALAVEFAGALEAYSQAHGSYPIEHADLRDLLDLLALRRGTPPSALRDLRTVKVSIGAAIQMVCGRNMELMIVEGVEGQRLKHAPVVAPTPDLALNPVYLTSLETALRRSKCRPEARCPLAPASSAVPFRRATRRRVPSPFALVDHFVCAMVALCAFVLRFTT